MSLLRKTIALAVLASLIVVALPSTALGGQPKSARGSGHTTGGIGQRVFAFTAVEQRDGTVTGQGQLSFPDIFGIEIHFAPDCLHVDGDTATISGVITDSNLDDLFGDPDFDGGPFWVRVVDNGQGANSPADEISGFTLGEPGEVLANCTGEEPLALPTFPIEEGNLKVTG